MPSGFLVLILAGAAAGGVFGTYAHALEITMGLAAVLSVVLLGMGLAEGGLTETGLVALVLS